MNNNHYVLGRDSSLAVYPRLIRAAATVVVLGILLIGLACLALPWQQSVAGKGQVTARLPADREQSIDAPVSGRLVRWFAQEGEFLSAGDPLFEISDLDPDYVERLNDRRRADEARLEAAKARGTAYSEQALAYDQWRGLKVQAARLKVTMGKQKVMAAQQKVEAAEAELVTTTTNLTRLKRMTDRGLESQRSLELAELSMAKAKAGLNLAKAAHSEARAGVTALKAELLQAEAEGQAKIRSAQAEEEKGKAEEAYALKDLAKVSSELARQATRIVKAPQNGTLLRVHRGLGAQVVKKGDQLATLVPHTHDLAVELWIDGNDMPLVRPGSDVRLQFEGWPAVQFVGWPSVAVGSFGGIVNFVDARSGRGGKVRILVSPNPKDAPWPAQAILRQGVMAQGWVLLEQVPAGWELWRRFNGFPLSVPPQAYAERVKEHKP